MKDMCKGRGKKGEGWRELLSRLLSRRLIPIRAGQRGRGGLGKPFPRGKLMPPSDNFPSFFLCLSFVPPIHGRDSSKTRGFVFLPRALTRGEFRGWHWGVCAHTPWRGDLPHQAAAAGPSLPPERGQAENRGIKKTRGNFVADPHLLKWEFLRDVFGKYFLLVEVSIP